MKTATSKTIGKPSIKLRRAVNNASRSVEGKRLGGKRVIRAGGPETWVWFLPQG